MTDTRAALGPDMSDYEKEQFGSEIEVRKKAAATSWSAPYVLDQDRDDIKGAVVSAICSIPDKTDSPAVSVYLTGIPEVDRRRIDAIAKSIYQAVYFADAAQKLKELGATP